MDKRVVLVACGSFNPITNMHLRLFGNYVFFVKDMSMKHLAVDLCIVFDLEL